MLNQTKTTTFSQTFLSCERVKNFQVAQYETSINSEMEMSF